MIAEPVVTSPDDPSPSFSCVLFHSEVDDTTDAPLPPLCEMSSRKKGGLFSSSQSPPTNVYELAGSGGRSSMEDASASLLQHELPAGGGRSGGDGGLLSPVSPPMRFDRVNSPPSLSPSEHSNSSSIRRKWRLPQSGLTLCGRRWLLGAEDMCLPACTATSFDTALLLLALLSWRYTYTTHFPDTCSKEQREQLESWVVLHALAYLALLLCDLATMVRRTSTHTTLHLSLIVSYRIVSYLNLHSFAMLLLL